MQTALFTLVLPVAYAFATPVATWGISECTNTLRITLPIALFNIGYSV